MQTNPKRTIFGSATLKCLLYRKQNNGPKQSEHFFFDAFCFYNNVTSGEPLSRSKVPGSGRPPHHSPSASNVSPVRAFEDRKFRVSGGAGGGASMWSRRCAVAISVSTACCKPSSAARSACFSAACGFGHITVNWDPRESRERQTHNLKKKKNAQD